MTASLDMPMAEFLAYVKPEKGEEFIGDIVVHLLASAVTVPLDLKGFDPHAGMLGLDVKGGHKSFVSKAVDLVVELARPGCMAPTSLPSGASQASFGNFDEYQQRYDEALQKALANALLPKAAPAIHVEVRPLLKDSCHLHGLDHRLIPDAAATDQLAMKHAAALKKGIVKPFTFVKLDSFLPSWCPLGDNSLGMSLRMLGFVMHVHILCFCAVLDGEDEPSKKSNGPHEKHGKMSMLQWSAAFDRGAIAGAVTGEWDYASAMAHKDIVLQVHVSWRDCNFFCHFAFVSRSSLMHQQSSTSRLWV